jgi:hypothetical protein
MLRLQGSSPCDLKPDWYVTSAQINSYLEPTSRLFCLLCKKKRIFCLLCKERRRRRKVGFVLYIPVLVSFVPSKKRRPLLCVGKNLFKNLVRRV